MSELKKIVIISDGTGRTAKRLMDAVLSQYSQEKVDFAIENIYQNVRTKKRIKEILQNISPDYLVVSSLIEKAQRDLLTKELENQEILHLDVLEPMLQTMSKFLGVHPDYKPGLLQIVDHRYYRKVDAIGYTVEHDDGQGYRHEEAEVILVGLSRTCKTPISMYLACNFGLKVANIPVIPDSRMKQGVVERLATIDKRIIFGLTMSADALVRVREERAQLLSDGRLGKKPLQEYHDIKEVRREVRLCRNLFDEMGWVEINVTRRAIEEVARELINRLKSTGRTV